MGKRLLFAIVMLLNCVYMCAKMYDNPWTEISREIVSAYDSGASSSSVDIRMNNGSLFIDINNVPCSDPEWYVIRSDVGNNALDWWLDFMIAYSYPPIENNVQFKYRIDGVTEGEKRFDFDCFTYGLSEKINIYDGCNYHFKMKERNAERNKRRVPFYNMEWIVYNPCDNQGKERFFQLRYGKKAERYSHSWDDMKLEGKCAVMYPVLMSDTERFDEAKADTIAMMSAVYDLNEVTAVRAYDVDIPSEFWATGLPEATYNPSKWPTFNGTKDVKHVYDINKEYGGFNFYNFDGDRFSMWFDNGLGSEETTLGTFQTRMVGTSNVAEKSQLQAKWMQIFGAVGDDYASNLPYPCYELPAGVKPAYLLCVRDFTTGEVLYGDDSKLPDTLGVKELPADETVGTGDGRTHYYNLQGVEVRNPGKGLYIRVKNGKAEKILLTE